MLFICRFPPGGRKGGREGGREGGRDRRDDAYKLE